MTRRAAIALAAAVVGALSVLGYVQATRSPTEPAPDSPALARPSAAIDSATPPNQPAASPPPVSGSPSVAQRVEDARSDDPQVRAAAIAALAEAPRSQALPALEKVLEVGEPEEDRQIALRSLHTIALQQGDDDGKVREILRSAIYHGDDDGVSEAAQSLLEDIEAEFAQRQPGR